MSKTRVHELAKTLGINSKELIEKLGELGVTVKNHMSAIEDSIANDIMKSYSDKGGNKQEKQSRVSKRQ